MADEQGHYVIDAEARKFGVPPDSEGFIPRAMEAWKKSGSGESLAEKLLRRYVPEGPRKGATPDEWRKWWEENRPYLFYSDTGGYRWYVDPLAKKRQTPCSELRGTKKSDWSADCGGSSRLTGRGVDRGRMLSAEGRPFAGRGSKPLLTPLWILHSRAVAASQAAGLKSQSPSLAVGPRLVAPSRGRGPN